MLTEESAAGEETRVSTGPLDGLRVVEMGQLVAGPFCGQVLGDLGAEVIKLEQPGKGDPLREWGRSLPEGESLWWSVVGRNKKSVTVDLRTQEGQAVAKRLIAHADIVVENFRPGTLERWGMSYDALSADNPGLILTRVSGFGQTGPYSSRAGYMDRSVRPWADYVMSSAIHRHHRRAWAFRSGIRWPRCSRQSAPWAQCTNVHAADTDKWWTRQSTKPCWASWSRSCRNG